MPAETYFCPHCKRQIKKSAQAYIMGESLTTKGAHFVALGGIRDIVPCPSCGGEIDNMTMPGRAAPLAVGRSASSSSPG
jgi:hypothetical protein